MASAVRARRSREGRARELRDYADAHGWEPGPWPVDLWSRCPVAPLLGAGSVQAHLVRSGTWQALDVGVALVSARQGAPFSREPTASTPAVDVLLVSVHAQPELPSLVMTRTPSGVESALLTPSSHEAAGRLREVLLQVPRRAFPPGDSLCLDEGELTVVHPLRAGGQRLHLEARLLLCQHVLSVVRS